MEAYFSLFIQTKVTNLAYERIFFGAANLFVFIHGVTAHDGTTCTSTCRG
jgi:hypothetical protein